jgi:hypothetical protein
MSPVATAPCPHCKAENLAHRRHCWRCKRTLPTSFAMDAELFSAYARREARVSCRCFQEEDSADALSRAMVENGRVDGETAFPYGGGVFGKRLVWLLRKRPRPT